MKSFTQHLADSIANAKKAAKTQDVPPLAARFESLANTFIAQRENAMDALNSALSFDIRTLSHPMTMPDIIIEGVAARLTIRNAAPPYYSFTKFPTQDELTHYNASQIRLVVEQTNWRGSNPYYSYCLLTRKNDAQWSLCFGNTYSREQTLDATPTELRAHLAKWFADKGVAHALQRKIKHHAKRNKFNKKPA